LTFDTEFLEMSDYSFLLGHGGRLVEPVEEEPSGSGSGNELAEDILRCSPPQEQSRSESLEVGIEARQAVMEPPLGSLSRSEISIVLGAVDVDWQ